MVSADAAHPRFHDQLTEPRRVVAIDNLKAVLVAWVIAGPGCSLLAPSLATALQVSCDSGSCGWGCRC
jgi:hypothetical protein